jgi:hypothetical protein
LLLDGSLSLISGDRFSATVIWCGGLFQNLKLRPKPFRRGMYSWQRSRVSISRER